LDGKAHKHYVWEVVSTLQKRRAIGSIQNQKSHPKIPKGCPKAGRCFADPQSTPQPARTSSMALQKWSHLLVKGQQCT
jgi:hypothetical protein